MIFAHNDERLFETSLGLGSTCKGSKPEPYPIKKENRNRCASGPAHKTISVT